MWFVPFHLIKENKKEIQTESIAFIAAVRSIPLCQFIQQKSIYLGWVAHASTHNGKYADAAVEIISFDFVTMDVELLSLFAFLYFAWALNCTSLKFMGPSQKIDNTKNSNGEGKKYNKTEEIHRAFFVFFFIFIAIKCQINDDYEYNKTHSERRAHAKIRAETCKCG